MTTTKPILFTTDMYARIFVTLCNLWKNTDLVDGLIRENKDG